jgi:integrase
VDLLFSFRGHPLGATYLNARLIPLLCRKAGVPRADAQGTITSHRARFTIASQLFNAQESLTLFELQDWMAHQLVSSTQHYAELMPTKVAKAYEKAGYFARNVRMMAVLIDQQAVQSGAAAGEPWK